MAPGALRAVAMVVLLIYVTMAIPRLNGATDWD